MLAENLQNWAKKERQEGFQEGLREGRLETTRNLIARTEMDDAMIAEIAGLAVEEVAKLRAETRH